jgi:hypothetical protein
MRLSSFLFLALMVLAVAGCGSSRQLQSLSISPASQTAQNGQAQFTASGQFNTMPMSESPVQVDWLQEPPAFDPPSTTISFTLTSQPFTAQCFGFPSGTVVTVIAFAPMDTSKSSGSMPLSVFSDLVLTRKATEESGFVAATAQMTCP